MPPAAGLIEELDRVRVLWTHNFDPDIPSKGSFMHITAEGLRARGVELHLEYLGNLRSARQILRARRHVRKLALQFDLVHAQFGSACALATAAVKTVPKVVTIRGNDWATHDATVGFLYFHTRVAAWLTRTVIASFDGIFPVSHRLARQVTPLAPNAFIAAIPSAIDLDAFLPMDREEAKARLGFANTSERWVLFNSLDLDNPIKRFRLAQDAFHIAQGDCGNLRLRLATKLPRKDLALFVAACDLILCTSETEGWPNSVKEALACDVPFVATDVSDLREIASVEPSCRVCPPQPDKIAANICEVLSLPRSQDLRRHVARMSVDSVADQIISAYHAVLAGFRQKRGQQG